MGKSLSKRTPIARILGGRNEVGMFKERGKEKINLAFTDSSGRNYSLDVNRVA